MVIKESKVGLSAEKRCSALAVNRSSYYKWRNSRPRSTDDESVKQRILEVYHRHKGTYGCQRITLAINKSGYRINNKRVHRLMKLLGLQAVIRKKWCCRKYIKQNVTENLLNREFNAEKQGEKLVCDVTELKRINDKRYYLYSILDLCGNKIVAHNVSFHNDNGLVMNCLSKIPVAKKTTLLHSDQGSQFTSHAYANIAKEKSITLSMSRVGNCYDNAAKESFFGHFKEEFYIFHNPKTEQELFDAITSFIDYYNNERIQIRLKGSPSEYLLAHSL